MATILVVEDNPITRKMVRVTLESEGYRVLEAGDGKSALELVADDMPDLVLQDVLLPDMSGFDVVAAIRARPDGAEVPILAFTGFLSKDEEAHVAGGGFNGLLVKPVEPSRLLLTIEPFLGAREDAATEPGRGQRLLLVEDDPVQRKLARVVLADLGFEVQTTADGAEALELARRNRPDAIVSDVLMPRLDGFRLCAALRSDPELCDVPVVLVTAHYVDEADRDLALRAGAQALVHRGPDLRPVAAAVGEALRARIDPLVTADVDDLQKQYLERVVAQLERQSAAMQGLTQRASLLGASLSVLATVSNALAERAEAAEVEAGLGEILAHCVEAAGLSRGAILQPADGTWHCRAALGFDDEATRVLSSLFEHRELLEDVSRRGVVMALPSDEVPAEVSAELLARLAASTAILAPLGSGTERLGVLFLTSPERDLTDLEWVAFAQTVGASIGQALALSRAFAELAASEDRYRQLFEGSPLPAWVCESETSAILAVNEVATEHYGYAREEMLRMRLAELEAPLEEREDGRSTGRVGELTGERRHYRRDGTAVDVELTCSSIAFAGGPASLVVARDVTARRQAERRLAAQFAVTGVLAESITLHEAAPRILEAICTSLDGDLAALLLVDPDADRLRCAALWRRPAVAMPAFEAATHELELRRGEGISGRAWADARPTWITERVENDSPRAAAAEADGLRAGGSLPIVSEREVLGVIELFSRQRREPDEAVLAGLTAAGTQIGQFVERARAIEALRQSEQRFRELAENVREVFFIHDPATGRALYVNPAYETVFGQTREYAYATPHAWLESLHPEDRARMLAEQRSAMAGGLGSGDVFRVVRDGEIRYVRGRASPVFGPAGEVVRIVGIVEDVTELKSTEAQLLQAQKMEAVGQLAGGIAHDFNNLLTAIIGNAELLRDDLPAGDPRQDDLQEILDASSGAAGLTRQLLAFSRKQVLAPRVIAVTDLVAGTERMLRRLLGEHIELVTRLDPETGNVRADPGQIEQVLVNLAVNAADAMPDGGTLIVETDNVELDGDYAERHTGVEPGPHVLLVVSDSGVGMSDEVKERLFEPFFTTKEAGRGTGLGLATVYGIVKQSGGSIWVYSEPGKGSTFKVYLPRVLDGDVEPPAPKTPVGVGGTETVLLVEDHRMVRRLSRRVLESRGYTVLEAESPNVALALAAEHAEPIAALVTDVVMPEMSGRALAERMVEIRPGIKVLYTSGYTADAIARHGVLEPGVWFLQKPYSREALGAKLRELLDS